MTTSRTPTAVLAERAANTLANIDILASRLGIYDLRWLMGPAPVPGDPTTATILCPGCSTWSVQFPSRKGIPSQPEVIDRTLEEHRVECSALGLLADLADIAQPTPLS